MSLRGTKRASGVRGEEPGTSKRRRMEPDDPLWQLRPVSDLKMSSIYNRSASEAPAELFRKDLISAMKLPDSEPLTSSEYWVITDTWKQDWERGVQVPVNPDSLPAPKVKIIDNPYPPNFPKFKLPKDKYIHLTRDGNYLPDKHFLSTTPARAEAACNYDLDATDTAWLKLLNAERARAGAPSVSEDQLEKVIEELEVRTWDKIQAIMKSEEGLGIEYDENVICDVCRSPDSEDGNEMVFCDSCNICVHQACYGITVIPDGQWLCRPCGVGVKPTCALCPNLGGAMKCTPSGHKWAHVSCVLWIPEVSIGCAEKMEPITKITSIPASRWSLVCVLCRERKGACIQCSVKTCKTAYHVTCAFKHGLEMRAIIEDENADDGVKLRSYCQKHSVNSKKEKCPGSGSEEEEVKRKRRKDMTSEEKTQARAARLQEIEREFDRHVTVKDISSHLLDIDQDAINYIYNYWKLKRRAGHNRPLLPPKSDDNELLTHRQEQADLDKMKMFVQLRQDLERVRNLCYMVSRREKLSRSFFRMREQTFHKQVAVLTSDQSMSGLDLQAIVEANHGPSIYDRLYSHPNAPDHKNDFEALLARIAPQSSCDEKKPSRDRNGLIKGQKSSNPYKKLYVNGSRRSGSMYSGLSSEESAPEIRFSKYRNRTISSTDDDVKKNVTSPKKKVSPKSKVKKSPKKPERKKKKVPQSKAFIDSSSSDDETIKTRLKKDKSSSKTLRQMEKEMAAGKLGQSGTESDDLMPMRTRNNNKFPVDIYSDSSDEMSSKEGYKQKNDKIKTEKTKSERGRPAKSPKDTDSQQSLPRTKAAMKEFVQSHSEKKTPAPEEKPPPKKRGRKPSNKEKKPIIKSQVSDDEVKVKAESKFQKQKDNPTDLIVPQRQAAKKASENMRSTTAIKKEEPGNEKQVSGDDLKSKPKLKSKGKETKDIAAKVGKKKSAKEQEKEPIAYVPQRQAAKKAAAHIKSGLGTKPPAPENSDPDKRKDSEKSESMKMSPKKEDLKRSRSPPEVPISAKRSKTPPETSSPSKRSKTPTESSNSSKRSKSPAESSSTSSNTSSSSYTSSSSSDDEPEKPGMKPTAKAREIKPAIRQPSMFSPPGTRPTVDLPFLDKVSRPLSSTSASSDSESSRGSRFSGSGSPSPKRPRRRRKGKSISTDVSPRKAPDKKLKTSERESECGVSSPVTEREESNRPSTARAATRARTRSTTAGGNMLNKSDARQRKSSKDDSGNISASSKTSKESSQSSKLQTPKRKTDEEVKKEIKSTSTANDIPKNDSKNKIVKTKTRSVSVEDKEKPKSEAENEVTSKTSPKKSTETRLKTLANRRMSVRDIPIKDIVDIPEPKARRLSKYDSSLSDQHNVSPVKKINITTELSPHRASINILEKKHADIINDDNDDFTDNDKNWVPKATSPKIQPPAVEKPGVHEKYMTEDKSMDSDSADKNSIKMIAKIQANLNENTMIKSPKTPMDARTITMDHIDVENSAVRKRRCSILDIEKKFLNQDQNLVQGVEISKSAKIPSAVNQFPNRAMFSPQSKDNEFFAFDMMAVDDGGFNNEDMIRPFTSYPEFFFKEDSKDQGAQETLNLVDRLRMQLSSKKAPSVNSQDEIDVEGEDKEQLDEDNPGPVNLDNNEPEIPVMKSATQSNVREETSYSKVETCNTAHETVSSLVISKDVVNKNIEAVSIDNNEKWSDVPLHQNEPGLENLDDSKYDTTGSNSEDGKELSIQQSDVRSVSEIGDTISLSKQSDDSQSLSVVDHSVHSNDVELPQDNPNYENNNSVIHSDCVSLESPYVSQRTKWTESKITTRRSSASSTNSETSICSQKPNIKAHLNSNDLIPGSVLPEIDAYPSLPYPCRVEPQLSSLSSLPPLPSLPALPSFTSYPSEPSPFLGTMGSLPIFATGACASSQLQLPSPGPGLYAPGLTYHGAPLIQPLPKPSYTTLCAAAFTSSSQNIALTTAMIAPPTPKPIDSPRDDNDASGSDKASIHVVSSPSISVDSYNEASRAPTKLSNDSDETNQSTNTQEPKSPSKTTKSLIKFHGKSPGKSPEISPKQTDSTKSNKRSSNRNSRTHRGRGRSKSRGHGFSSTDFSGIQSKLVGTVYDFDEEIANDGVDIKALRDRRKSIESREDRSEYSYKDSSQSPSLSSPKQPNKRPAFETKEIKPSTPEISEQSQSPTNNAKERTTGFSDVRPVLPGPVDMRTYSFDKPTPTSGDANHSHLLAFASGTADQHLVEIDEEVEKQLHTELMGNKPGPSSPQVPQATEVHEPVKEVFTPQLPKVSLSDSRNQLKVKIKGPFLDANYSASSVQPVAPQPPPPAHDSNTNIFTASNSASSSIVTGSNTNLRRMRKKELLRQYWTQDMNMDDPTNTSAIGIQPPPPPQPLTRAVITIPKAVASMTSIPTREDYKIIETPVEKKKRKTTTGLSRELRHLEVSMNDDVDTSDDMKLSTLAGNSSQMHKRRPRVTTKPNRSNATSPIAPKLKIKISSNVIQQVNEEPLGCQFRPPKKRLTSIPKPSLEDLRRESMKYRRKVMADFEEDEKTKKYKTNKSEKRKKKKEKKSEKEKLRVINSESESATKLIIKIKRTKDEEGSKGAEVSAAAGAVAAAAAAPEPAVDPFEYFDPTAVDPLAIDSPVCSENANAVRKVRTAKVTPIRLKLSRSSQGSGYVMKEAGEGPSQAVAPASPLPVAVSKHCEVR